MHKLTDTIQIGDQHDCNASLDRDTFSVIHACKDPCHTRAVGRRKLPQNHANYLSLARGSDLYLNMIDPPVPLFKLEMFKTFFRFAEAETERGKKLFIHCNKGLSRAPSLAMLLLARGDGARLGYEATMQNFKANHFPAYAPGQGIEMFMTENWVKLMNL